MASKNMLKTYLIIYTRWGAIFPLLTMAPLMAAPAPTQSSSLYCIHTFADVFTSSLSCSSYLPELDVVNWNDKIQRSDDANCKQIINPLISYFC